MTTQDHTNPILRDALMGHLAAMSADDLQKTLDMARNAYKLATRISARSRRNDDAWDHRDRATRVWGVITELDHKLRNTNSLLSYVACELADVDKRADRKFAIEQIERTLETIDEIVIACRCEQQHRSRLHQRGEHKVFLVQISGGNATQSLTFASTRAIHAYMRGRADVIYLPIPASVQTKIERAWLDAHGDFCVHEVSRNDQPIIFTFERGDFRFTVRELPLLG